MKIALLVSLIVTLSLSSSLKAILDEELAVLTKKVQESSLHLSAHNLDDIEVVKKNLALMVSIDQEVRFVFAKNMNDEKIKELMLQMDRIYTSHMKAILRHHPWITISKFGSEADHNAWLLVQHADHDPDFQRRCFKILQVLLPAGETDKQNYAYLYDRVALKDGKKQRYGTQVRIKGNQFELFPTEEKVDSYRQELGLIPLDDYLKEVKKMCFPGKESKK